MAPPKSTKSKIQGKTQRQMAVHLDMSQQRVAQFVTDGTFPSTPEGKLDQDVCRVAYIRWLRDESRKSTASANTSRVQAFRAQELELRIAREAGRLLPLDGVNTAVADILGTYRSELAGLPAAVTRDLDMRVEIEKYLNDAIDRCRASFERAVDDLRAGREGSVEDEEPDT